MQASGSELEATLEDGEKGLFGMSKRLEGMVYLNIGAALFGSNMVRFSILIGLHLPN